jgi:hypothetical protein
MECLVINDKINRRRLLSLACRLGLCMPFITVELLKSKTAFAQEAQNKTVIYEENYNKWLAEVNKATKTFSEESGKGYDPNAITKYDKQIKKDLNDKGYIVRPGPPTDLQIQVQ